MNPGASGSDEDEIQQSSEPWFKKIKLDTKTSVRRKPKHKWDEFMEGNDKKGAMWLHDKKHICWFSDHKCVVEDDGYLKSFFEGLQKYANTHPELADVPVYWKGTSERVHSRTTGSMGRKYVSLHQTLRSKPRSVVHGSGKRVSQ